MAIAAQAPQRLSQDDGVSLENGEIPPNFLGI
jgi:hypothetical protein